MNKESRKKLSYEWGPEIVVKCCRYWKLHIANGTWGSCGICRRHPQLTQLTWDQIDLIQGESNEINS